MPLTPKIIHFIWAGGSRALPKNDSKPEKSSHHIIEQWANDNPGFQPILWVDSRSLPESVIKEYKERGYQFTDDINKVIKAQFEPSDGKKKELIVADIGPLFAAAKAYFSPPELILLRDAIFYEMDNFHPNYGGSSDLLRYLILTVYGGAYFDSDVAPGKNSLDKHPAFTQNKAYFNVTGTTQGTQHVGNDAFLCSPGHPLSIELVRTCLRNYTQLREYQDPETFNTYEHIFDSTLARTGPVSVRTMLKQLKIIDNQDRFLKRDYQLHSTLTATEQSNTNNWLRFPTVPSNTLEEAINRAAQAMTFELRYLKTCRHSDYVRDISLSLRENVLSLLKAEITNSVMKQSPLVLHFYNLIEPYAKNKSKNPKNFEALCQDISKHLNGKVLDKKKIDRIITKLDQRYSPSNALRSIDKLSILINLIDFGKGGILGNLLAEENVIIDLFPKLPVTKALQEAYVDLVKVLQEVMPKPLPTPEDTELVRLEDIYNLLEQMNPDVNPEAAAALAEH